MSRFLRWPSAVIPACLGLILGCHTLKLAPPSSSNDTTDKQNKETTVAKPSQYSFRVSQFVFFSDFELRNDAPLFKELSELRDQVYKELHLPVSDNLVSVYLFEDQEHYKRFMSAKYPFLPSRRAFFVAQPHNVGNGEDRLVYTFWGDHIQQDLRHELTHALLHSVLKDVPLWLDEGLAEYFELPVEKQGVSYNHVDNLLHRQSEQPLNLLRLEKLDKVKQMNRAEYREAWAWVHMMLHSTPETKKILLDYLHQLQTNPKPDPPLYPRLAAVLPSPEKSLQKHLAQLEAGPGPPVSTNPR